MSITVPDTRSAMRRILLVHQQTSGFPLGRDALDTLEAAGAWERLQRPLDRALGVLLEAKPEMRAPDLTVALVLGDPEDEHFMGPCQGMTAFGGITGYITITFWPYPENLARLEPTAAHELHHNLRFAPGGVVWDPATVTVGDQIVAEGLADAYLAATGQTAAQALHAGSAEVIAATPRG
ncbi:DUF2268 domain-containing putative Zn-dependent protease [Nonomuraea sp. NPDC050783]|uniref:DUF2268 domain-containing putative Zn-dependent protease n=1 Tax=Nonomuraea sp. NPDC050783 TaxID=3154634 RepID=UPI003465A86A